MPYASRGLNGAHKIGFSGYARSSVNRTAFCRLMGRKAATTPAMSRIGRLALYCGSSESISDAYRRAAADLGKLLARKEIEIVYGGGSVGLMGEVANASLAHGGHVIGVIPKTLDRVELKHTGVSQIMVVDGMHSRKAIMASLSDGFIALPGGFGTLDEFFEVVTWNQIEIHNKPTGLLNVNGYFDKLLDFFDHTVAEGFISPQNRARVFSSADPEDLLHLFETGR